jgi:hypothetical protein
MASINQRCLLIFGFLLLAQVTIFAILVHGEEDYYRTLGVAKTATSQQIKQAYKKLALQW